MNFPPQVLLKLVPPNCPQIGLVRSPSGLGVDRICNYML